MTKFCVILVTSIVVLSLNSSFVHAGWSIDVESGLVFSGYNDVRIPGKTGTDISLSQDLEAKSTAFVRLRFNTILSDRQQLFLLVAPLRIESSGTLDHDFSFNGIQFDSGVPLNALYRFDSYRLTYQYTWYYREKFHAAIGFTGKIRDAAIRVENSNTYSEKSNTGFVPLINFAFDWRLGSNLGLIIEGDALAAPQGRAEDVQLAIYGTPLNNLRLRIGYRVLEGGADNDEVYNFALVHYISAGVSWSI